MQKLLLCLCFVMVFPLAACDVHWYDDDCYDDYTVSEYVYEEEYIEEEVDEDDASGGLEYWSNLSKGDFRDFYGQFKRNDSYSTCNDHGYNDPDLELPYYLMLYSYGDMMDFETSSSDLVWNTHIHFDGTFEFETNYLDWYGDPSVVFPCSCIIYNAGFSDEAFECECEPSHVMGTCSFYYELI